MNSDIDYSALSVPADKPTEEYTYNERRAAIYDMIEDAGHPRALEPTQTELGEMFGVSQRQISTDIQRIREYEAEHVGENADTDTELVCRKAVMGLLEQGRFREAGELQLDYYDWLQSAGYKDKAADQLDVDLQAQHTHAHANLGAYSQTQDPESDQSDQDQDEPGADGLTKRQREQIDALTSGPSEIAVETPTSSGSDGSTDTGE